jgi:hypothetical protein
MVMITENNTGKIYTALHLSAGAELGFCYVGGRTYMDVAAVMTKG